MTPTEDEVRKSYVGFSKITENPGDEMKTYEELDAEFDQFLGSVRADGFMAAQSTMQETVGEAMRDYAERVWAQCSAWHAEQGMGVEGAEDKHNPHTVENRAKLMEEFGL